MSDEILECCDCGSKYKEGDAKHIPDPDKWHVVIRVCPECDCPDFYISEVADD